MTGPYPRADGTDESQRTERADSDGEAGATGLAAPGTRAVLVGTGRHAPGSALPGLPGVDTTLDDLHRALREVCGMPEEHIHRVPADATAPDVQAAVEQAVAEATGTVLFCYTGHGLLGPDDELYLATHAVMAEDRVSHGVPYHVVKGFLGRAVGGSVVILDCCFSGRAAAPGPHGPRGVFDSALPDGSFLLTSASGFAVSYAPEGERHTLFGGRLLRLLREGDPSGPPLLTMDGVHAFLDRSFRDGPVRPHRQSAGTLGTLIVAPNRAYRPQRAPTALPPADVPCPYPGMEPFRTEDHAHFFGREKLTERLLDAVCGDDHGPLVLVGASGAGKSSLLRAGVLAGLDRRRGSGRPGTPWPAVLLPAPGPHPLRALAERWARATGRTADEVHRALAAGERLPAPRPGFEPCRLLVVDQFEEVFTRCADPEERARFVRLLCAPDDGTAVRPRTVLALRADHYGDCLAQPELVQALEHGQFTVPPMGGRGLRSAVERPALRVGLTLEDGLTDRLLADVRQDSGPEEEPEASALPFLAHALRETWLRRSGCTLTLAGYQATGGLRQSVATTGEALYQELDAPARAALRELLLRMVQLTAGAEAVRRRVGLPELLAGRPERERRTVTEVCERLAAARLVTIDRDVAQIAHEALLRAWPRLRSWIREARAELLAHQELSEAATAWDTHGRDPGWLYTGSRLERVRPWLAPGAGAGPGIALTATERAFAEAGVRAARRTRIRRRVLAGVAAVLALLLTGVGTVAAIERDRSRQRAAELDSKRIAAQAEAMRSQDPAAALDLSLAAYRTAHTVEARTSLLRSATAPVSITLAGHTARVVNLAFDKSGKVLASSSPDGTVRLWNLGDPYHPAPGPVLRTGAVTAIAWRPDGRYLTGVTQDGLFVWDTADPLRPREVARVTAERNGLSGAAFSPDGRTLVVPSGHGRLRLWDLSDPAHPVSAETRVADDHAVHSAVYSPDGRVLATAVDDGTLRLWEAGRGPGLKPLATVTDVPLSSLAFRPDGHVLLGGGVDHLKAWDVTDPAHPRGLKDGISASIRPRYTSVAFRPDGAGAMAGADDGQAVHLYDFDKDDSPGWADRLPIGEKVWCVAYLPGGRGVVAGDDTGRIVVREPPARSLPGRVEQHSGDAPGHAVDPSGRYVATGGIGSDKSPVRVWEAGAEGQPARRIAELPRMWARAMFFAEGLLISEDEHHTRLGLWSVEGDRLRPAHEFVLPPGAVQDENPVALSVNDAGTLLALRGASEEAIGLWDIRDRNRPRRLGQLPWPKSTDGTRTLPAFTGPPGVLAVMLPARTELWDVRDARHPRLAGTVRETPVATLGEGTRYALLTKKTDPRRLPAVRLWTLDDDGTPHLSATSGRLDPTGLQLVSDHALVTASEESGPTLWDLRKPQHGIALPGPAPRLRNVLASRDRRLVVASNYDGAFGLWHVSDPDGARPGGDDALLALSDATWGGKIQALSEAGDLVVDTDAAGPLKPFGVRTLVVSTDFGRLGRTLCSVRRNPVPDRQWKDILPGITPRDGCR
ncbi:hypothetical protein ACFP1Z_11595 [Streptomyces gamaensis]|uniref:Novel STAND NTPase 1 domain-containing protein n=1 Tax=Streptomyces gamaensis TaxID=1763542 RepID=A0ABW0YW39_9ACTN